MQLGIQFSQPTALAQQKQRQCDTCHQADPGQPQIQHSCLHRRITFCLQHGPARGGVCEYCLQLLHRVVMDNLPHPAGLSLDVHETQLNGGRKIRLVRR